MLNQFIIFFVSWILAVFWVYEYEMAVTTLNYSSEDYWIIVFLIPFQAGMAYSITILISSITIPHTDHSIYTFYFVSEVSARKPNFIIWWSNRNVNLSASCLTAPYRKL